MNTAIAIMSGVAVTIAIFFAGVWYGRREQIMDRIAGMLADKVTNRVAKHRLIGWRTNDYLFETKDRKVAQGWQSNFGILPIYEDDPDTKLSREPVND